MLVIQAVEFVFVGITLPLYVAVLVVIAQSWYKNMGNLNFPIFKCCFIVGVIDVVMLFNNIFFNVLPKTCLLPNFYRNMNVQLLHVYFYIAWSGGFCQAMAVFTIALNRLSIFVYSDFLEKLWRPPYVYLCYLVIVVPGFGVGLVIAGWPVEWLHSGCRMVGYMSNPEGLKVIWTLAGGVLGLTSLAAIAMYVVAFVSLQNAASQQAHNVREYRLLIVCAANCGMQTLFACYAMSMQVFPDFMLQMDHDYTMYNLINDIYSGINPYLLIAFSTTLRDRLFMFFGCQKPMALITVETASRAINVVSSNK